MTTVLNPPQVAAEERFVLYNVSWETYEQLLKNYEDQSGPRLTYDNGVLEFMSPSLPHDQTERILELLVNVICEEFELDVIGVGHTTQRRFDLRRGLEPDACFYIQNVDRIRGVRDLDLKVHPPPDLVIEVDFSSSFIPKIPIYAELGVPEIWHFRNDQLVFLKLTEGNYIGIQESVALPRIVPEDVLRFVIESHTMKRPQWLRAVREWLRSLPRNEPEQAIGSEPK